MDHDGFAQLSGLQFVGICQRRENIAGDFLAQRVEKQVPGRGRERPGQRRPVRLAVRNLPRVSVGELADPDRLEQRPGANARHERVGGREQRRGRGSLGAEGLFSESTPYAPNSPYSASKAGSDHLVRAYHHTYGLPTLMTNCSNNYGPYQFPEKLIPLIINNALNGKDLPVYGDGKNVRDWLYVVDHCTAILEVLKTGRVGETYNVGGNSEKQNIEVVQTICDILDEKSAPLANGQARRSLIKFVKDRAGHDRRYAIDASKIRDELGWVPSVTFEDGIRMTIDWYLGNAEWMAGVLDGSYQEYYAKMYGGR